MTIPKVSPESQLLSGVVTFDFEARRMVIEIRLRRSDSLNGFGFRIRHRGDGPPTVSDVVTGGPTAGLVSLI